MTTPEGPGVNVSDQPWSVLNWSVTGSEEQSQDTLSTDRGTVSRLMDRTQGPIMDLLKANVQQSPGWKGASEALWAGLGLRPGIPLPVAIIEVIAKALGLGDAFDTIEDAANAIVDWVNKIPGVTEIKNFINTLIQSALTAQYVSIGNIGSTPTELLVNPAYDSEASVDGAGIWTWDGSVSHSTGTGSVKVSANAILRELLSDPMIPISGGQTLTSSHWLQWSGVSGSGVCFRLGLVFYNAAGGVVDNHDLATISNPASSSVWTQLSGQYAVPLGLGVVGARLRLNVTANAAAGTVWWDDGSVKNSGLLAQNLITNLLPDLAARVLNTEYQQLLTALGAGSATLAAIVARFANLTPAGVFDSAKLGNIAGMPLLNIGAIPVADLGRGNIGDLQGVLDGIATQFAGAATGLVGVSQDTANNAMSGLWNTILHNAQNAAGIDSITKGAENSGTSVVVNFGAVNTLAEAGFAAPIYSGPGTSTVSVGNGVARWNSALNGNRSALVRHTLPTTTDYQRIGATMVSGPVGIGAINYVYARMNAAGTSYIYLKIVNTALLIYTVELGYVINGGAPVVLGAATSLPVNANIFLVAGTPANSRQLQVLSGTQPVITKVDSGAATLLGSDYRFWGFGGTLGLGGLSVPGSVRAQTATDNRPPDTVGSFFRQRRTGAGVVGFGPGYSVLTGAFFDAGVEQETADMSFNPANGGVTVTIEGTYHLNLRAKINNLPNSGKAAGAIFKNGGLIRRIGGAFADGFTGQSPDALHGNTSVYLTPNDMIQPGVWCNGTYSSLLSGEGGGVETWFEMGILNRSLA